MRRLGVLALLCGCTSSSTTPPAPPPPAPLKVERFDAARDRGPPRNTYGARGEPSETWLEVARAPDRSSLAIALGEAVELRAMPGLSQLWRNRVTPDEPYGSQPAHPLLAFTADGSRLAWLGGAGFDQRLIVYVAATGVVEQDVVFPGLPQPTHGGGGVTPEPTPEVLQAVGGGRYLIHNTFASYEIEPAALRMAELLDRSRFGLAVNTAEDSGAAWDLFNGVLARRGGGGSLRLDCRFNEDHVAIDEGLDRAAILCLGDGYDDPPQIHLRRLSSGESLGRFVYSSAWGRLVILDANSVLVVSHAGNRDTRIFSLVVPREGRHDPANNRWEFTE